MSITELLERPAAELTERGVLHTAREIAQQADTWLGTLGRVRAAGPQIGAALRRAGIPSSRSPHVVMLGAGTSDYVGQSVANLLRTRWRCPTEVIATTDFATHAEGLLVPDVGYLSVSFSRSGNSPESVAALEHLLKRQPAMPQFIVTCDARGKMASECAKHDNAVLLLLDDLVNDRGLAMTSSYTNMVLAGLALAHWNDLDRLEEAVHAATHAWRRLLPVADSLAEQLAQRSFSKVYFFGSGALNGVARESALKLLELTAGRVSSGSESFLGVRHGPLSALDSETLVVALVSSDPRVRRYELDLLRELRRKQLGKSLVVIAQNPEPELRELADYMLGIELVQQFTDDQLAPVMVLFGQLLGLYSSMAQGLRPDAPSPDGIISRVVSGVEMHA